MATRRTIFRSGKIIKSSDLKGCILLKDLRKRMPDLWVNSY